MYIIHIMPTCKIKLIVNKVQSFFLSDKKLYLYNNIWHNSRYSYFSSFLALIRVSNIFLMECWPQLPLSMTWHSRQMIPVIKTLHWPTSVFILLLGKYVYKIITLEQDIDIPAKYLSLVRFYTMRFIMTWWKYIW